MEQKKWSLTHTLIIAGIIIIVLAIIFKPWDCQGSTKKIVEAKNVSVDTITLVRVIDNQNKQIASLCRSNDSLTSINCNLTTMLRDCADSKKPHVNAKQNKKVTSPVSTIKVPDNPPPPATITKTEVPPLAPPSGGTISDNVQKNFCGLNNYIYFSIRLNGNDGNYFPQIAQDKDKSFFEQHRSDYFSHAVLNTTGDGIDFKFFTSEFVDQPNGSVCMTRDGRICIPVGAVSKWVHSGMEVIIWSGTIRGFQKMVLSGDNYIYKK